MTTPFQIVAAPHTPFHPDGSLNTAMIARQAMLFLNNGVQGVFCCGTTGEGTSLTLAERKQVTESWVAASGGQLRVIAHIGHSCQKDVVDLAEHARFVGADAVAAVAPHFIRPNTIADLISFFTPVALACAPLPFLYYDIPTFTHVRLSAADFLEQGGKTLPNLGGVKFTNIDVVVLQECIAASAGKYEVFFGVDELLLAGLSVGVRRAVGSTYNFTSKHHLEIVNAFDAGDHERAKLLQRQSVAMVRLLEKYGGAVRAGKALMSLLGVDCGPVRAPLAPMTTTELASLHTEAKAIGLLNDPV
jgi:N-acetylneuraminate lyase